jgi:hypothetical protein
MRWFSYEIKNHREPSEARDDAVRGFDFHIHVESALSQAMSSPGC